MARSPYGEDSVFAAESGDHFHYESVFYDGMRWNEMNRLARRKVISYSATRPATGEQARLLHFIELIGGLVFVDGKQITALDIADAAVLLNIRQNTLLVGRKVGREF